MLCFSGFELYSRWVPLIKDRGFNSFTSNMIKLSVNETKWSSLLARTRALFYISIWIFDFGPEKLPGLSRNGPLNRHKQPLVSRRGAWLIGWWVLCMPKRQLAPDFQCNEVSISAYLSCVMHIRLINRILLTCWIVPF